MEQALLHAKQFSTITSPTHRQLCGRFNENDNVDRVAIMEGDTVMVVELVLQWIKWVSNKAVS